MKHTLVALVQDRPGVLSRTVSLWRRRGFNIESLTVGGTETPGVSRMTLVVDASETNVEQVIKQMYRLIEVLKVSDITADDAVEREMLMVKVHAPAARRAELAALAELFDARVSDVALTSMIFELTSTPARVANFIEVLQPYGIKEMMRTGRIAMVRGAHHHSAAEFLESNGHAVEAVAALN